MISKTIVVIHSKPWWKTELVYWGSEYGYEQIIA